MWGCWAFKVGRSGKNTIRLIIENNLMEMATAFLKKIEIWGVSGTFRGSAGSQNHPHQRLLTSKLFFLFPEFTATFSSFFQCLAACFDSYTLLSACLIYKIPVYFNGFEVYCWLSARELELYTFAAIIKMISGNILFCWYEMSHNYGNFSKETARISVCIS